MQREFSKELAEDRQFEIGGELFQWRYPHWTEMAAIYDDDTREAIKNEAMKNGDGDEDGVGLAFSYKADTEFAIERIPIFLDTANDGHKRFKTLVARKTDPVPRHQIGQLYRWLLQVTSGVPTNPPSDSESGGGGSEESSEEESS